MEAGEEVRFVGTGVGCAEEENAVGAGVDGVEVSDFGCCSTHGVCECLSLVSTKSLKLDSNKTGVLS